ncbi:MAG: hypothetical protein DRP73_04365 [Candidatus Omnitrophota bacterium]|nr:MAG: hypothetical protein DRP73_04365 [Candidatus Omnitrophota bacterium]
MMGKFLGFLTLVIFIFLEPGRYEYYSSLGLRRVKGNPAVPSPPGVDGEVLLRNLYAFMTLFYKDVSPQELMAVLNASSLSQIAYTHLSQNRLTPVQLRELTENLGLESGGRSYNTFEDRFENPSGDTFFGDFLPLFRDEFVHLLNTSSLVSAFKFVKLLVMAENIASQILHELDNKDKEYVQRAFARYVWALGGGVDSSEERIITGLFTSGGGYYGEFGWDYYTPEDQNTILAVTFILLEDKIEKSNLKNLRKNLPLLIQYLSENEDCRERLWDVKRKIDQMLIPEHLQSRLFSYFPDH